MVVLAVSRFAQLLLAACTLVGCSSGPRLKRDLEVHPGELTRVRLIQVKGKLAFSLQNDSAALPEKVFTANSSQIDPGQKVVGDGNLQTLLDVFSEKGLFGSTLTEVPADARDVIVVEQGKRRWLWARCQLGVQASEQAFHEARAEFLALYNSSVAYHGSEQERPDFRSESSRIQSDAANAKARLEEARLRSEAAKRNQR